MQRSLFLSPLLPPPFLFRAVCTPAILPPSRFWEQLHHSRNSHYSFSLYLSPGTTSYYASYLIYTSCILFLYNQKLIPHSLIYPLPCSRAYHPDRPASPSF